MESMEFALSSARACVTPQNGSVDRKNRQVVAGSAKLNGMGPGNALRVLSQHVLTVGESCVTSRSYSMQIDGDRGRHE